MFTWTKQFETGIELVDDEHKKLVDLLNDLHRLSGSENGNHERVDAALVSLKEYATKHFSDEEALMETQGVDERHVKMHRMEHKSFVYDIEKMSNHLDPDETDQQMSDRLAQFVTAWLTYHILGIDQSMARQVSGISKGMDPSAAFEMHGMIALDQQTMKSLMDTMFGLWKDATDRCYKLQKRLQEKAED